MRRSFLAGLVMLVAAGAIGCGAEDHPNEPRPPAGVELSGKIDNHRVVVAPASIGAGLARITFSNQSDENVTLDLFDGTGRQAATTNEIAAGGVGVVQLNLKRGDYEIAPNVGTISSGTLAVGAPRPSAQNDLLLP